MTSFRKWLDHQKAAAKARGGKPLPFIPGTLSDSFWTGHHKIKSRKAGELFNPRTGEFITGCLTVSKLADELGMTSTILYSRLEALGIMHRVIDWKDVPMLCQPFARRPEYFHRYRLTPMALDASYGITVKAGEEPSLDLITPDGQVVIRANFDTVSVNTIRDRIKRIVEASPGLTHTEIARCLGCSQPTVSRHLKQITVARAVMKLAG